MSLCKTLCFLLSFIFLTQALPAQTRPRLVEITPAQMQLILEDSSLRRERLLLAQNESPAETVKKKEEEIEKKKEEEDKATLKEPRQEPNVGLFGHLNLGGGGGNREAALIVFAVIGLVIVVAWIPYFPVLLYETATGKRKVDRYHHFSFQHILTGKYGHGSTSAEGETLRYGSFLGGRYSLFLRDQGDEESWGTLGFSSELGHYRFKDRSQAGVVRLEGGYWLLGPSMLFGAPTGGGFPLFTKLDLLAGSSFDSDLGLVTRADFSVGSYLFGSNASLGLGVGALYLHSKKSHGILNNGEELGLIFSGNLGFSF